LCVPGSDIVVGECSKARERFDHSGAEGTHKLRLFCYYSVT
jgi:hypothetical protein